MACPKFVWIIRTWCSHDSFWEHVREHKEYDIAYVKAELALDEIDRIILKEQSEWEDLCDGKAIKKEDRSFEIDRPSLDILKSRRFLKFLTVSSVPGVGEQFMQSWYVERLGCID